jgi:hypothetical protein
MNKLISKPGSAPGEQKDARRFQGRVNLPPDPDVDQSTNRPVKPLSAARRPEKADDYPAVVARLGSRWRVIECRDAIQWILQRRKGQWAGRPQWQAQHYCRTRCGLLRCIRKFCGPFDDEALAIVRSLPERIGGRR